MSRFPLDHPLPKAESCPSDLWLDRLCAGEIAKAERARHEDHLNDCAECGQRLALRRAGFDAFPELDEHALLARLEARIEAGAPDKAQATQGPSEEIQRAATKDRRTWIDRLSALLFPKAGMQLLPGLAVVGLLLGAGFLWGRSSADRSDGEPVAVVLAPDDSVRVKGSIGLRVYRMRGDTVEEVTSGDTFASGDKLRFKVTLPRQGELFVVGAEANGKLYGAYPAEGHRSVALDAGSDQLLDDALELDASTGREWLHAVYCPKPFALSDLRALVPDKLSAPEGCAVDTFEMVKTRSSKQNDL
jgi:hypothetical protein